MTIENLIELRNIRALFAVFFNLCDESEDYFVVRSEYRASTFVRSNFDNTNYQIINDEISRYFGLAFESTTFGKHTLKIEKTPSINTAEKFLSEVYRQIQLLSFDVTSDLYEESIFMALFMLRGSADFSLQFYSVDIYRRFSSKEYLRNVFQILSGTSAISQLNLNFREFQPQFTDGRNIRNTQIRVKLGWFWSKFGTLINEINIYKYLILSENDNLITQSSSNIGNFSERLLEYLDNVLGEEPEQQDITQTRRRLGLEASGMIEARDYNIKNLANNLFPDECMGCNNDFTNDQRTFKLRESQKHYFEIHHIIPFSAGKEHDQIDNLAKLCPVCHRVLTKNRATEDLQKRTITNILNSSPNAKKYVGVLANDTNINNLVSFVYTKLV